MRDYIIATDSDSELLYSYAQEMKIPVFAMPVTMDGKDYDFDLDIEGKFPTFFEDLKNGSKVSTSAKSPWEVKQWFLELLESGKDILYIGFSNQLSIHFSNCQQAVAEIKEERPEAKIVLVDTLSISAGQSLLIRRALKLKAEGKSLEEVAEYLEDNKLHSCVLFSVDDLNYLKRGGRLSGGAAFVGTVLDLKPIVHVTDDGKLVPTEKCKGRKKAWRRMAELLAERFDYSDPDNEVIILYAELEDGKAFEEILKQACGEIKTFLWKVGPVIGGHAGPGVIGVSFFGNPR